MQTVKLFSVSVVRISHYSIRIWSSVVRILQILIPTALIIEWFSLNMCSLTVDDIRKNNFLRYVQCFRSELSDNVEGCTFLCQIANCGKSYKDKSGAIRHLKRKHSTFYQAIRANNEKPPE